MTTEVGRQPWVVYHVMRTSQAVTGAGGIAVGYATLALVYLGVACGVVWILRRLARAPLRERRLPRPLATAAALSVPLYEMPLIFVLVGLVLYAVLAGADFGAGFWQLLAGPGGAASGSATTRTSAMAPVWEANHVWLIFVLTVFWTAYPAAFGSIASTLCVPLFLAAIGIVMRGAAYALRAGTSTRARAGRVDTGVRALLGAHAVRARHRWSARSPRGACRSATPPAICSRAG